MQWSDLEPGMVVELENGYMYYVFRAEVGTPFEWTKEELILRPIDSETGIVRRGISCGTINYDNDMTNASYSSLDIMKVYKHNSGVFKIDQHELELIWERKKNKNISMSLTESDICVLTQFSNLSSNRRVAKIMQELINAWKED